MRAGGGREMRGNEAYAFSFGADGEEIFARNVRGFGGGAGLGEGAEQQRTFKKIERAIETDFVACVFDAEAGVADRRAIAPEGFAETRVIQAEADMGEIDRDLPRPSDSLRARLGGDLALRKCEAGG